MKRYVLLFGLFLPLLASAQTVFDQHQQDLLGKGHLTVGVEVGQGYRGGGYPIITHIAPRIQYFILDGWSVAVEGRYLQSNVLRYVPNKADYKFLGGGLSTRYYFLRGKRVAIFAQLGTVYGRNDFNPMPPNPYSQSVYSTNWQTNAGLGVHYRISKRWALEAMGSRSWLNTPLLGLQGYTPDPNFNRWQFSVGISYRLK
ncbi:hypothetical protein GCM10028818_48850 [Spirosoma horti]